MNTIFFDLGNVLIFFSLKKMFDQLASCIGLSVSDIQEYLMREKIAEKYEVGRMTSQELYQTLLKKSPKNFSFEQFMHAMADIFTPNTDLWPIVEQLHAEKNRLVLLSNTNECHFRFAYSAFPILKLFDRFILSYEVGASKPSTQIFQRALQEAEGKTFYTDDIPAFIEAGRAAGLDAETFCDAATLKRQLSERGFIKFN